MSRPATVHASAVLVGETGILIRGTSGSGKSSLLLALLAGQSEAARLVADDRVILAAANGRLLASPPPSLAGLIEIRGQGVVRRPHISPVIIGMVVDLVPAELCPRMPEASDAAVVVQGVRLPRLILPSGAADGALRLGAALTSLKPPPAGNPQNPGR
jgi:HPr kinase/phosphorylase